MRRSGPDTFAGAWEGMKADYAAAKSSRFVRRRTGISTTGSGADYHYWNEADYLKIMEYIRDMDRNDLVVSGMVDRLTDNIVQDGLTVDPQTGDSEFDQEMQRRFTEWGADPLQCDTAAGFTWPAMQWQVERAELVDGDHFGLPRDDGTLQLIEAHRLRTPSNTNRNVIHGVLLDSATRRPVQYWITKDDIDPMASLSRVSEVTQYPAFDTDGNPMVFHVKDPKRVTQTRGVTVFVPVFAKLGMWEDIEFAKLVQQQIVSAFAILRTRTDAWDGGTVGASGEVTSETLADGSARIVQGVAPGMEIAGAKGELLTGFSPNVPNPEFFEHAKLTLRTIGACVDMPLIAFLLDGSETNFTGWRGAMNQAQIGWRRRQCNLRDRFVIPTYRWRVRWELLNDPAFARSAPAAPLVYRVRVNLPRWPHIQPLEDAKAAQLRIDSGQTSPRRLHNEMGQDYVEVITETIADKSSAITQAIEAAQAIEEQTGVQVDYHELLSMPPTKAAAPPEPQDQQPPEPPTPNMPPNAAGGQP